MKKTINLLMLTFGLVVGISSCVKGPKGDTGPAGPAGTPGANGAPGTPGTNSGSIVSTQISPNTGFTVPYSTIGYSATISVPSLTSHIVDSGAVQVYIKPVGTTAWQAIPWYLSSTQYYTFFYGVGGVTVIVSTVQSLDVKVVTIDN